MQLLTIVLSCLILGSQIFLALGYCEDESSRGTTFQISGQCALYTCDGAGISHGLTCPTIAYPNSRKCAKTEDKSKPYPECCPKFTC